MSDPYNNQQQYTQQSSTSGSHRREDEQQYAPQQMAYTSAGYPPQQPGAYQQTLSSATHGYQQPTPAYPTQGAYRGVPGLSQPAS